MFVNRMCVCVCVCKPYTEHTLYMLSSQNESFTSDFIIKAFTNMHHQHTQKETLTKHILTKKHLNEE